MAQNVVDITHLLDKEEGSSFDQESRLFSTFDGGNVFDYSVGYAFVREMKDMLEVDAKAQTLESVLSLPIRSAPFSIQRGRSEANVYERIHEILTAPPESGGMSTPLNLIIAQMCNAFVYKKAFFEKVWTRREGGGVRYDKVAWRPPSTCTIQRDPKNASFQGFRQMPIRLEDTEEREFSPLRSFVYIHGSHRDPLEGVSDLTITQWCYKTKQKIRFLWYQFLEGQSLPKTVVKAPDETVATEAAKKIIGLRSGGVVGVSDQITTDVLESSGRGAAEFKAAMQWLDAEASSSVLAGFTDLGAAATSGIGSFALSKDQTDFFLMSRQAVAKEMQDYLNQYLVADLVRWNFGPQAIGPKFEFGPISQDDAQAAISLLQATAQTPLNQSYLPPEFFNELALRVAGFLELDVVTVREGLERARKEAEKAAETAGVTPEGQKVAGVAGAVDKATNAVQQKVAAEIASA
jgi:hypothetical protein